MYGLTSWRPSSPVRGILADVHEWIATTSASCGRRSPSTEAADVPIAIVTGSGGLIGSESVAHFVEAGFDVIGIENDMRSYFFGPAASTAPQTERLLSAYGGSFRSLDLDIRDADAVERRLRRPRGRARARRSTPPHSRRTTGPRRSP